MTADEIMREKLDDHDYQVREVYAQFGLTSYTSQVMESGLINLLALDANLNDTHTSPDTFDRFRERYARLTLGRLLGEFESRFVAETDVIDSLQRALPLRNRVAHHFFWDKSVAFMSIGGRESMLAELYEMREAFADADSRVSALLRRIAVQAGLSPERIERSIDSEFTRLIEDGEARYGQRPPMDVGDSS